MVNTKMERLVDCNLTVETADALIIVNGFPKTTTDEMGMIILLRKIKEEKGESGLNEVLKFLKGITSK